jgi:phosphoesterase RecJ-like protein
MNSREYKSAFEIMKSAKTVNIVGHMNPDGDTIGCAIALKSVLCDMGKTVNVFFDCKVLPRQFHYLDGYKGVINSGFAEKADLLIIVDLNVLDRMGVFECLYGQSDKVILIDHHIAAEFPAANVCISNKDAASCGEIVYEFFKSNNIKITPQIANALYTAVATDTGCFLYPSTTGDTHNITAELLKCGADLELVNYNNFRVYDRHLIIGIKTILKHMRFYCNGRVGISGLKREKYRGYTFDAEERDKFKKYIADVRGVVASAFFHRDGAIWRCSLRSHGDINIEPIAKYFNGGGHKHAAGFSIKGSYANIVRQTVAQFERLFEHL